MTQQDDYVTEILDRWYEKDKKSYDACWEKDATLNSMLDKCKIQYPKIYQYLQTFTSQKQLTTKIIDSNRESLSKKQELNYNQQKNTSGQGSKSTIPKEIEGWNWGAFLLNWLWGIGNNSWERPLHPGNWFLPFRYGSKGNEWAWRNKHWSSIEHFKTTQRKWVWSGIVFWVAVISLFVYGYIRLFFHL